MTNGTRRGWGVSVTPRPLFTPGKDPGTHCTGGWVGPRAGLDRCGKSRPPPGFDPRTVQPVASRYTTLPGPHVPQTSGNLFSSLYKNKCTFVLFVFEDKRDKSVTWNWVIDLDRCSSILCSYLNGKYWEALLCRGNAIPLKFVECCEHVYSSTKVHFLS